MTKTDYAIARITQELERRQSEIDTREMMRSLTVTVLFNRRGTVDYIEYSAVERRELT